MINIHDFLLNNYIDTGTYTLVTYNGITEAIYFSKFYSWSENKKSLWFLESPCQLYRIMEVNKPVDEFCKLYIAGLLDENEDKNDYIEKYVKPMIIDNVLYEIENFQCAPYLPKEVDNIKLISERECLKLLLDKRKEDNNGQ